MLIIFFGAVQNVKWGCFPEVVMNIFNITISKIDSLFENTEYSKSCFYFSNIIIFFYYHEITLHSKMYLKWEIKDVKMVFLATKPGVISLFLFMLE